MKIQACILLMIIVLCSGCSSSSNSNSDSGICPYGFFHYSDIRCGAPSADGGTDCTQVGDMKCYKECASDDNCKDQADDRYCSILGLYNGYDWNCSKTVKICRQKQADDCVYRRVF
jgi:hypothetical protein